MGYPIQSLAASLWWSPFRRPFEFCTRRLLNRYNRILTGPMRGLTFSGGLAQKLGIYERSIQLTLLDFLSRGSVFYDIGANNGFLSLVGGKLIGPTGWIYCFEPHPANIRSL